MISTLFKKVFGNSHTRFVKKLQPIVDQINAEEERLQSLTETALKAKTQEFRDRIQKGETVDNLLVEAFAVMKNACRRLVGTTIRVSDKELVWDMVPYDVQLIGALALHRGGIAELQTGEGKTLVATMPLYLNALTGRNCQLVTVNDYLARRDCEWCGAVLRYLGVTTGCIQNAMTPAERREQYACDVTYGTNSEFGFDYLRDMGMATDVDQLVQRDHYFCIIDEVDSILVDEARTPLIISGPAAKSTHRYDLLKPAVENLHKLQSTLCNRLVAEARQILEGSPSAEDEEEAVEKLLRVKIGMPRHKQLSRMLETPDLRRKVDKAEMMMYSDQNRGRAQAIKDTLYFAIDERHHEADLSELGRKTLRPNEPDTFVLPDLSTGFAEIDKREDIDDIAKQEERQKLHDLFEERSESIHNIAQLLRAFCLYEKDRQYVVGDNKVIIVDENTGRPMPGRRFSDGLHQALEAKEGVTIERETQTLASVTIQNYFRMYEKLSGMTGTAETEASEFLDIYKLKVVVVPTNKPCLRVDHQDLIFKTKNEKYRAIIEDVRERHEAGQPVLLGTVTVDVSEKLSRLLKREKIIHNVLNAKNHAFEAQIVEQAGQRGAVTIATNMAGRGTDIKLGEGVRELGGLHVIGSERHDSRRIDRQLRGRCSRQGDPGSSRFYISLEDDLMRLFGSEKIAKLMDHMGIKEGEELSSGLLTRTIETAQRKVEQHHFSIRKRTLQFDNVMNKQREAIYGRRRDVLYTEKQRELLFDYLDIAIYDRLKQYASDVREKGSPIDQAQMLEWLNATFPVGFQPEDLAVDPATYSIDALTETLLTKIEDVYTLKVETEDAERLPKLERHCILEAHDRLWQEHLYEMDHLRQAVYLVAHAQKDPLVEYQVQARTLFDILLVRINEAVASNTFRWTTRLQVDLRSLLASLPQEEIHQVLGQFDGDGISEEARDAAHATARSVVAERNAAAQAQIASHGSIDGEMEPPTDGDEDLEGMYGSGGGGGAPKAQPFVRGIDKTSPNSPCPCGSGKKFKKCCGR